MMLVRLVKATWARLWSWRCAEGSALGVLALRRRS